LDAATFLLFGNADVKSGTEFTATISEAWPLWHTRFITGKST
jgi:hypothetical protein